MSSNSLCLTKAMTKISQLAWHAKHALFLLKLLRTLRSKCQKLKQIVHVLPELGQILQLFAALCSPVLAARALCCHGGAGVTVLQWDFSDILHKRPWLLHFTHYHQSVQQAPCSAPDLQTSERGGSLHSQFWLQFGNRRKWSKIKKIVSHTYAVCHVFKREQVSQMFWVPSQKCTAQEDKVQGSHVGDRIAPQARRGFCEWIKTMQQNLMLVSLPPCPWLPRALGMPSGECCWGRAAPAARPICPELCWPRPALPPLCCRLWAPEPRGPRADAAGSSAAWSLRSLIGSLQRCRLLPPRPGFAWKLQQHSPQLPWQLTAGWARDSRALSPPSVLDSLEQKHWNPNFNMSLLLLCPCCVAALGLLQAGQFLEMSVYVGQHHWGILLRAPSSPPFLPQKHLRAVQFCNWNVPRLVELLGMQRAALWPADRANHCTCGGNPQAEPHCSF